MAGRIKLITTLAAAGLAGLIFGLATRAWLDQVINGATSSCLLPLWVLLLALVVDKLERKS